jgi:hypothetical protein
MRNTSRRATRLSISPQTKAKNARDIANLEVRLKKIEDKLERPPKDIWDKFNALSGILSGVLVAVIGFYATQVYDRRSKEAERSEKERNVAALELQTIEKFFPHLVSNDETEKQAAIEAISSLTNVQVAIRIAGYFRGPGARAATV